MPLINTYATQIDDLSFYTYSFEHIGTIAYTALAATLQPISLHIVLPVIS